jgi:hypothetical protein
VVDENYLARDEQERKNNMRSGTGLTIE